jgi:enoyl-[acyl-carrier-protein] reductase (NADH)
MAATPPLVFALSMAPSTLRTNSSPSVAAGPVRGASSPIFTVSACAARAPPKAVVMARAASNLVFLLVSPLLNALSGMTARGLGNGNWHI